MRDTRYLKDLECITRFLKFIAVNMYYKFRKNLLRSSCVFCAATVVRVQNN